MEVTFNATVEPNSEIYGDSKTENSLHNIR